MTEHHAPSRQWSPNLEISTDDGKTWTANESMTLELRKQSIWPDVLLSVLAGVVAGVCAAGTFFALLCYHNPFKLF
ncbi:hypothetical protein SH661x_003871 [Planctomicrobium sp. SH661]|uniref:hypothetical protein n=1 Tax=Planctomicrobium sp. SH661 TaxID=3448124 RepID=UPI003F5BA3D6